ncbi:MAG: prepilin-type N-terminal cleavage/methylation domain-containing protein, partial [candidate division NC10 bacterium]|nr:prepilin-type N-terminal cleavage/methylation domain-containing protein [candidate division NC10 bacterium]
MRTAGDHRGFSLMEALKRPMHRRPMGDSSRPMGSTGFTAIELLIALVIAGILVGAAMP